MVKAIFSNPLARKVVASTMFATAVVGANATNLKNEKSDNFINQTEVVSKEAASALRVHVQEVRIHQFQHNEKLDKMLLKTCEKQKDVKNLKEKIDDTYNSIGTYRTSIEIQRGLDNYYVEKALNEYTGHYALSNEDSDLASEIISHFHGWKDQVYYNELYKAEAEVYKNKKVLTAQECSEMLDKHLNNTKFFTEEDKKIYNEFVKKFISKQSETSSVNSVSDLLAYKCHLINSLAFNNYFMEYKNVPKFHILISTLGHTFVNGEGSVKP